MAKDLTDRAVRRPLNEQVNDQVSDHADQEARRRADNGNLEFRHGLRRLAIQRRQAAEHVERDLARAQTFGARHHRVRQLVRQHRSE